MSAGRSGTRLKTWGYLKTASLFPRQIDFQLDMLSRLPPHKISKLRNLYVLLSLLSRPIVASYSLVELHRPPQEHLPRYLVDHWLRTIPRILSHASPQQLQLHLRCDVLTNAEEAREIVQPFYQFPGKLRSLELQLSSERRYQPIIEIARQAVKVAEPRAASSGYFHFFALPLEIRQMIFSYTDLVTPHKTIHRSPDKGFNLVAPRCFSCPGRLCRDENLHFGRSFYICRSGNVEWDENFCCKFSSGWATLCSHGDAMALLLTSRSMYEEAFPFFLRNNRIVICSSMEAIESVFELKPEYALEEVIPDDQLPRNPRRRGQRPTIARGDATKLFIDKIGPNLLRHVLNLEIVFPRAALHSSILDSTKSYIGWCSAVDAIAAHADPSRLSLRIMIWCDRSKDDAKEIAETRKIWGDRLIRPLCKLTGLKRLFVMLEWDSHWSPPKMAEYAGNNPRVAKRGARNQIFAYFTVPSRNTDICREEEQLEKLVMGQDYDSYAIGKGDEMPSAWLRRAWIKETNI